MNKFSAFMKMDTEINKLGSCAAILHYDMATAMPSAGSSYRGELMEMLSIRIAKMTKAKKFVSLLTELSKDSTLSEDQKIIIDRINESVVRMNRIPVSHHGKIAKAESDCHAEWALVKKGSSDKKYLKQLDKLISLIKKSIDYSNKGEFVTPYDSLLDGYSRGISSSQISVMFADLLPFINKAHSQIHKTEGIQEFHADDSKVMSVGQKFAELIIGAPSKFTLSKSTHPFCTTLGVDDVRITTRIKPGNILDSIGSTIHESGHATYELGLDKTNYGNVLGSAASIAAHEGISLFYEKHIGESASMINQIAAEFGFDPIQVALWMRDVDSENLIRTESDEITYQKHIINRFTIENEIFNGDLKTKDIPARWNELYGKDLEPSVGYAVDVHWCQGSFGYFPSYTIGHIIAAQLKQKMSSEIVMFGEDTQINFVQIREWLQKNYFCHAGRYNTSELVKIATGSELSTEAWKQYITEKFSLKD